jgi:hypothetical protein
VGGVLYVIFLQVLLHVHSEAKQIWL